MQKFLKIFGIVAGVFFILILIAAVLLFRALPSPQQISQALQKPKTAAVATAKSPDATAAAATTTTAPTTITEGPTSAASSEKPKPGNVGIEVLDGLLDDRKPFVTFCDSLSNAGRVNDFEMDDLGPRFAESVERDGQDPLMESMKPLLKFTLRQPRMQELMSEIKGLDGKEEADSFMQKADFYRKMYSVFTEMKQNQAQTEQIMDRTYHLMMMAKAVAQNPDLLKTPQVEDYCHRIESSMNSDQPMSFDQERKSFNDFLAFSQVDPKSIGYDPNYRTHLKVVMTSKSLTFQGGWLEDVFKGAMDNEDTAEGVQ